METLTIENALILFLVVANWYLAQFAIYYCAKAGILWYIIKEGHAIAVMKNGKFWKLAMRFTGFEFVDKKTLAQKREERSKMKTKDGHYFKADIFDKYEIHRTEDTGAVRSLLANILFPVRGVAWVGFPPFKKVDIVELEWTDDKFEERKENISQFLVKKYVYGLVLPKLELQGGIPYDVHLLVTLYLTNPAKAYYRVKHWINLTMKEIEGWSRKELSALSVDDFNASTETARSQEFQSNEKLEDALNRVLENINNYLSPEYGVGSSSFQVQKIDPSNEEMRGIIMQKEIAKQKGEAELISANYKAQALTRVNEAAEKLSLNAMQLEAYHAIENAGSNVTLVGKNVNSLISVGTQKSPTSKSEGSVEPITPPSS